MPPSIFPGLPSWGPPSLVKQGRSLLWRPANTTFITTTAAQRLSLQTAPTSVVQLFAETINAFPVVIGTQNLRTSVNPGLIWDNAMFSLDPGRSAWIYTDDLEKEYFDLKSMSFISTNAGQIFYMTVWTPTGL